MTVEISSRIEFTGLKKPKELTPLQIIDEVKSLQGINQKILSQVPQYTDEINVNIKVDGPVRFIPISDTHLFSMLTDYDLFKATLKILEDKNTFTAICGDFLEGANPNIPSHIPEVMFSLTDQVFLGKKILRYLVNQGKVLAVVGMYNGHEEWAEKMTMSAIMFLTEGLEQPDGTPLQAVINGGKLNVRFNGGEQYRFGLYHDAGGGGSDGVNQLGHLRRQGFEEPLNDEQRNDTLIAGHLHHRGALSIENKVNPFTGKEERTIYASLGAYKSTDDKRPDRFLKAKGKKPNVKPGFGMILNLGKSHDSWATYGYGKLGHIYRGATYWDKSEKLGITSELIEKIKSRSKPVEAKFDRRGSSAQIPETDDTNVPLFDRFKWKITSSLPIAIYTISHLRKGSTSGEKGEEKVKEIVETVSENDHAFLLVLRHMLDSSVSRDLNRLQMLTSLSELLKPAHDKNSLLGMMLSAKSFRSKAWQKDLWDGERKISGFRPGDKLYNKLLPRVPLFINGKVMDLGINDMRYSFLLLDELGRSGSSFNMFQGLVQMSRKMRIRFDVVMGGHMEGAGIMQTEDSTFIAPGWYSLFDSFGMANALVAPSGGQGIILLPQEKTVFAASSSVEMVDIHTALMLKFGLTDKEKVSLLRKKRR